MKYLKYAFGEIVLVVIGILIAVQINNWNTSQSDAVLVQNFIENIKSNIKEDLNQLDYLNQRRKDALRIFPAIQQDLETGVISNVDTFGYAMALALSEKQFISNRNGFTGVVNSGFIEKVPFDISDQLYRYYAIADELIEVESKYNLFCEKMESEIHLNKGVMTALMEISNGKQRTNVSLEDYLLIAPHEALYIRGPYDLGHTLTFYSTLEELGNEIIEEIVQIQ